MKLTTKAIACAAALAASGSALAIGSNTVPAANQLFVSGATATDQALYQITSLGSNGLCQAGSIDIYIDVSPNPPSLPLAALRLTDANDQFMVACTGRAGAGTFGGQSIVIAKESNGGSSRGTGIVARSTPVEFLNPAAPTCAGSVAVAAEGALAAYTLNYGCSGVADQVPDAGIADVEAALFLNTAGITNLTASPLFQIVFAPAVSLNLYRALQSAQGLTADDDPANAPNITRGQLHRIFAGEAFTWDEFQLPGGADFLPGEDIYICRRGNDSGTQASFASFVMNERCNATVPGIFPPDTGTCEAGGCDWDAATFQNDFIFAADGSGDVRECLDFRNDNNQFAIGVLSTNTTVSLDDSDPNTPDDREIRFVGLDGAAATLSSVGNGGFHFVTENVLNERGAGVGGVPGAIVDEIVSIIGTPSIISDLNVGSRNPGGDTGILGRSNGTTIVANAPPVSQADMRSNPVSSFTRSVSGATNNCQPISATADSQIIGGLQ